MMHDEFDFSPPDVSRGLCVRYKGKAPKPPTSAMTDTARMGQIRTELYPYIENAMAGNGYGPQSLVDTRKDSLKAGYDKSFAQARGEFNSNIARTVKSGDTRVTRYLADAMDRQYASGYDMQRRQFKQELVDDEKVGFGMAADALSAEKRMTASNASAYNQAMAVNAANRQQYGTFGTNVAGGVASGMMDYYFAKGMSGKTT